MNEMKRDRERERASERSKSGGDTRPSSRQRSGWKESPTKVIEAIVLFLSFKVCPPIPHHDGGRRSLACSFGPSVGLCPVGCLERSLRSPDSCCRRLCYCSWSLGCLFYPLGLFRGQPPAPPPSTNRIMITNLGLQKKKKKKKKGWARRATGDRDGKTGNWEKVDNRRRKQ